MRGGRAPVPTIRIRASKHKYKQLETWAEEIANAPKSVAKITSIDITEKDDRLVIRVSLEESTGLAISEIEDALAQLAIPRDLVVIEEIGIIEASNGGSSPPSKRYLDDEVRPLSGGLKVGVQYSTSCTTGFFAKKSTSDVGIIIPAHCFSYSRATSYGDDVAQPSFSSTRYKIGEVTTKGRRTAYGVGSCNNSRGVPCLSSDSAFVKLRESNYLSGSVADVKRGTTGPVSMFPKTYSSIQQAVTQLPVEITGANGGLKIGVISSDNVVGFFYTWSGNTIYTKGLYRYDYSGSGTQGGDSGGPVLAKVSSRYRLICMHIAGNGTQGWCEPIGSVTSDLSVRVVY